MRLVGTLCVSATVGTVYAGNVAAVQTGSRQDPTNHNSRIQGVTAQVGRIIPLLEGLGQEMADQFKTDEAVYDKKACTYEETIEEARKTRAELQEKIDTLTKAIEQNQADIGALKARIASAKKKLATLNDELAEAQDNREKEHNDYAGVVATLNQDIGLLHDAYTVLDEFMHKSLAQTSSSSSSQNKNHKAIWATVRESLQTLPLGGKSGISAADAAKLQAFLDTDVDASTGKISFDSSSKSSLLQASAPMSTEGQGILGILKQMRGQEVAELQGRQEMEQATAAKHAVYVEQTNTKIELLQNEQAKLEEQLASREAMLSENTQMQEAARTELAETEKLLEETIAASKALAKAHAELTQTHTLEMNGLAKAIEILSGQQTIHTPGLMLMQTSDLTSEKNVHIEDMFFKINSAIQKKIKALTNELQGLKEEEEACKEQLATIAAVGASQEAMQNTLKTKIAATQAEIDTLTKDRDDLSKKVSSTEASVAAGQSNFEAGDSARQHELDELVESKKAIAAALQALHDAGSENGSMGQAIEILKMIATECDTGIKEVKGAKDEEMKAWGEEKTSMLNLIREMETQIQTLDHDLSRQDAQKAKQEAALKASEEQGAPDPAECNQFLADYPSEVKTREDKITQLKDAASALANWQNFSAEGGTEGSATLSAMKTAEEHEAAQGWAQNSKFSGRSKR